MPSNHVNVYCWIWWLVFGDWALSAVSEKSRSCRSIFSSSESLDETCNNGLYCHDCDMLVTVVNLLNWFLNDEFPCKQPVLVALIFLIKDSIIRSYILIFLFWFFFSIWPARMPRYPSFSSPCSEALCRYFWRPGREDESSQRQDGAHKK